MTRAPSQSIKFKRLEHARKMELYAKFVEEANQRKREEKKEVPRGTNNCG